MKKLVYFVLFICVGQTSLAQLSEKELLKKTDEVIKNISQERPNGWTKKGAATFLANQAIFNNWLAGGQTSFSGNITLNYDINYKSDTWNWDNKFIAGYGLTKIKKQRMQKTDDRMQLNSLLGKKFTEVWYYSFFFNFNSQFDSGFEKGVKTSHLFSPVYIQFGPGILWKRNDNFKINVAPATSKVVLVHRHFTENGPSFGVKQGNTMRYEFGAAVNGYYKCNLMENVVMENIMNLYSNYHEDPQNIDIDYTLNINMKVNKYLSTNFAFQTIYDDNAFAGFQTRQNIGIGVKYTF
jgi:hypothetical protein